MCKIKLEFKQINFYDLSKLLLKNLSNPFIHAGFERFPLSYLSLTHPTTPLQIGDEKYNSEITENKCFGESSSLFADRTPKIYRVPALREDPVEDSEGYLMIKRSLEDKIEKYFNKELGIGVLVSCFEYWKAKKRILKDDYQIEWKSPADLNPSIFGKNEVAI